MCVTICHPITALLMQYSSTNNEVPIDKEALYKFSVAEEVGPKGLGPSIEGPRSNYMVCFLV